MSEGLRRSDRKLIAGFGSLLFGGLGQLYNGELRRAAGILAVRLVGLLSLPFMLRSFVTMIMLLGAFAVFHLWCVVDGVAGVRRRERGPADWYSRWYSLICYAVFAVLPFCFIDWFLRDTEVLRIPSASMATALNPGDYIVADRRWYGSHRPERGDLVTLQAPDDPSMSVVRRVVAIEGDSVEVRGAQFFLNGVEQSEPYAVSQKGGVKDFPPQSVPPGKVFLLGDNRDLVRDSRHWLDRDGKPMPFVDQSTLNGKVAYIFWSLRDLSRIGATF